MSDPPPFDLAQILAAIGTMKKAAMLVTVGGTVRDMAADYIAFHVKKTGTAPGINHGESDYLLRAKHEEEGTDKPVPTLDNVMLQNWNANPYLVDAFMGEEGMKTVMEKIYGPNFRIAIDRFGQQRPSTKQPATKLQASCHVDFPKWAKVDVNTLHPDRRPALKHVKLYPGYYCVIVIDQGTPHMIPITGDSTTLYVGALTEMEYAAYANATLDTLSKKPTPRSQHLPCLARARDIGEIIAFCLLTGSRPVLHPSGKPIKMPEPYNASRFKYFSGYTMPPNQTNDVSAVVRNIKRKHGDSVADVFARAAKRTNLTLCQHDPTSLSRGLIDRMLGEPGTDYSIIIE